MNDPVTSPPREEKRSRPLWFRLACFPFVVLRYALLVILSLWAVGALYYDFPIHGMRNAMAVLYGLFVVAVFIFVKHQWRSSGILLLAFALVLGWWLTIKPSNERAWQGDVGRTAWAEIEGDKVTIHNFRNFDYRTAFDYTPHWETRSFDLSKLTGVDLFVNYWGSAFMAHPIVSFQFSDGSHVCMSIETRKTVGEDYSAIGGFYRQYELIYIPGDERDLVRVRTNYRKGEDVYLYHTQHGLESARTMFLEYVRRINELHERPEFYNAITSNCTTNIRAQSAEKRPWDWRILLNGYGDQMMYERGMLAGNLPFPELKKRAWINQTAKAANDDPEFSKRIRENRPGFE